MPGSQPAVALVERSNHVELINCVFVTHEFLTISCLRQHRYSHIIYVDRLTGDGGGTDNLDPNEFECLELNFQSALVLPNLYKTDKFIAKALQNDGKVLILEPRSTINEEDDGHATTSYQKAIAIILGYLMSNFELSFWHAYEALRKIYRAQFELDRFLVMQLYEYEPILQVQKLAEEMGHSRSGERLRSVLKRSLDEQLQAPRVVLQNGEGGDEEQENRLANCRPLALPIDETMVE